MKVNDMQRQEYVAMRKRILQGMWAGDLNQYIAGHIDPRRAANWGAPNMSINLLRSTVTSLTSIYDEKPMVISDDDVYLGSLFTRHQQLEEYVLALRECAIRIGYNEETHLQSEGLTDRLVTPDVLIIEDVPSAPGVPALIMEKRSRLDPMKQEYCSFWDVWDIRDIDNPSFRVVADNKERTDYTSIFAPDLLFNYPYIDERGYPFLPWVLYHAKDTGEIWDSYCWDELLRGTLALGLLYTFYCHAVKDASWVQKYAIDVELQGLETVGEGVYARDRIPVDPGSILMFRTRGEGGGSLGSFPLPVDPSKLIESIRTYQLAVWTSLGLGSFNTQEQQTQSGIALQIQSDQVRKLSAQMLPTFRKSDLEYVRKCALISNIFANTNYPTEGYMITYPSQKLSTQQIVNGLTVDLQLIENGLATHVDLIMKLRPELTTRGEALEYLIGLRREQLILDSVTTD